MKNNEKDYIKEEKDNFEAKREGFRTFRNTAGFVAIVAGMILAVCTMDGSEHEILMRFVGVAAVAVGALMCGVLGGGRDD